MLPKVSTITTTRSASSSSAAVDVENSLLAGLVLKDGQNQHQSSCSSKTNINNSRKRPEGDHHCIVPTRRAAINFHGNNNNSKFLISVNPKSTKASAVRGPRSFTEKMLTLNSTKNKSSQKQEKAEDLSILSAIEQYRRPFFRKLMVAAAAGDGGGVSTTGSLQKNQGGSSLYGPCSESVIASDSHSEKHRNSAISSMIYRKSTVSHGSSNKRSHFGQDQQNNFSSEEKENSARFHPYRFGGGGGTAPEINGRNICPKSQNVLDPVPNLYMNSQQTSTSRFSTTPTNMIIPPPPLSESGRSILSCESSQSSSMSIANLHMKYVRPTLQGVWVTKGQKANSNWPNGLVPDPAVTARMSIPELIQIVSGNVAPPRDFFLKPSQNCQNVPTPINFGINLNGFDNHNQSNGAGSRRSFGNENQRSIFPSCPPGTTESRSINEFNPIQPDEDFLEFNLTGGFSVVDENDDLISMSASERSVYF